MGFHQIGLSEPLVLRERLHLLNVRFYESRLVRMEYEIVDGDRLNWRRN